MQTLSKSLPKTTERTFDKSELLKMDPIDLKILIDNEGEGNLKGIDCPICKNKGHVSFRNGNYMDSRPCECMKQRAIMQRIQDSGLNSQFANYRFDNFETKEDFQKTLKRVALKYIDEFDDTHPRKWFYLGGQIGSGKTHLITSITRELIKKGYDTAYMQFSEEIPNLENGLTGYGETYIKASSLIERFNTVEILVIDDAFKNYSKQRVIWNIINHRYINPKLVTIISSQYTYDDLVQITGDESFVSRIYQRCTSEFFRKVLKDELKNYRMKGTVV